MIAVIQRVKLASVWSGEKEISSIKKGLLVFLGIENKDENKTADGLVHKIHHLRIFPGKEKSFDRNIMAEKHEILVVSQFTLLADLQKGRKPDFHNAAIAQKAKTLYQYVIRSLQSHCTVKSGVFGAHMQVKLINDGPATFILQI